MKPPAPRFKVSMGRVGGSLLGVRVGAAALMFIHDRLAAADYTDIASDGEALAISGEVGRILYILNAVLTERPDAPLTHVRSRATIKVGNLETPLEVQSGP